MTATTPVIDGATQAARRPQRLLLPLLLLSHVTMFALYHGVLQVLLPLQIEQINPAEKVANLGLVSGLSAIVATFFNPLAGSFSDRTRSRFGRRSPWILGGAVLSLGSLAVLGSVHTVPLVLLAWSLTQATMNSHQAALTAVIPDRIPRDRRGLASATVGLGLPLGGVVGVVLTSRLTHSLLTGYLALAILVVVAAILFTTLTRDSAPAAAGPAARSTLDSVRTFFACLSDPDVFWVFLGRALLVLGYFVVGTYQLYILQDFITRPAGLSATTAIAVLSPIAAISVVLSTVVGGLLSDRLDRRKPFVFAASCVAGLAGLIPLLWPTWLGMVAFTVVSGVGFGCFLSVDTALATLVLPSEEDNGRDLGVINMAGAAPQVLAPFVASVLVTHVGGYRTLFIAGAVLAVLGAMAVVPIRKVR
jgi:MFS family permease